MTDYIIPLSQGYEAIIDSDDIDLVSAHNWYAQVSKWGNIYASASDGKALHRVIMGEPDCYIDHKDGNGLNNRRSNLRECTNSQNQMNTKLRANKVVPFKGVLFNKSKGKFRACIYIGGKEKWLGTFTDPVLAARAYDKAALEAYGEFARTNDMLGLYDVAV